MEISYRFKYHFPRVLEVVQVTVLHLYHPQVGDVEDHLSLATRTVVFDDLPGDHEARNCFLLLNITFSHSRNILPISEVATFWSAAAIFRLNVVN